MRRTIVIAAIMVVFSIESAAITFGSISFDQEKLVDGQEATYRLGLINPMNETVTVELETTESGPLDVVSDQEIELPPSETARSPSGSGWMVYGDGYIKPETTSLSVRLPRTASEQVHTFSVIPTIRGDVPTNAGSSVAFATQHRFRFETTLPLGGEDDETSGWPIFGSGDDQGDETPDDQNDQSPDREPEQPSSVGEHRDRSPITGTTLVLLASIIIVSTYIWRQI